MTLREVAVATREVAINVEKRRDFYYVWQCNVRVGTRACVAGRRTLRPESEFWPLVGAVWKGHLVMKRLYIILAAVACFAVIGTSAALAAEFDIPIDTVVYAEEGSLTVLADVETPEELVGSNCVSIAVAANQESVHPGNDLIIETGDVSVTLFDVERSPGAVTPAEGAETSIYLASSDDVKGISGKYWDKSKIKKSSKRSYTKEDAQRLWLLSEKLCDIDDYFSVISEEQ